MKTRKYILTLGILFFASFCFSEELIIQEEPPQNKNNLSLSLSEVTTLALKNNLDIKIAKLEALMSQTDLEDSRSIFDTMLTLGANYTEDELEKGTSILGERSTSHNYNIGLEKKLPTGTTLEVDVSDERSFSDSVFITVNPSHDASASLSITQEIGKNSFGLVDRGTVAMTELAVQNVDLTTLNKIEQSVAAAQKAYWKLVLAEESVLLEKNMLAEAQRLYKINEENFDLGTVEEADFLASGANVTLRETELLLAENELQNAAENLKLILDLKTEIPLQAEDKLVFQPASVSFINSLKKAIDLRRDYIQAKNNVEKLDINLKLKKNSLWPQIDLTATWKRNGLDTNFSEAVADITGENNSYYYAGIEFEFPLENREAKSAYKKADFEKAKALLSLKKIEEEIAVGVDEAVREVNIAQEAYLKRLKISDLQRKKLEAETRLYNVGRSSSFFIIDYQRDLLLADFQTLRALYNFRIALIDLKLTQNSLLSELGIETEFRIKTDAKASSKNVGAGLVPAR